MWAVGRGGEDENRGRRAEGGRRDRRGRRLSADRRLAARGGEGRRGLALFLAFAGFYLLTASGHFYAVDEETLFRVTEGLVERGSFALPEGAWGMVRGRGGAGRYSQYAPGQSVLAVPLYLLGRAVAPLFPPDAHGYVTRFFVSLLGPLATAAAVAILYRLGRALGYGGRAALGLAAIYGLATTAWPHGRTFFSEPLTALFLLLTFYAGLRGTAGGLAPGWLAVSGAAAGAAIATKPQAAIALPVLGLYFLWRLAAPGWEAGRRRFDARRLWRAGLAWGAGLALPAAPLLAYNALVYGGPLRTGYGGAMRAEFTTPFLTGLYGLTLSSGKGLLWYSPPILLAIAGWWPFFRRHRAEALACLGVLLAHLAFYSPLKYWHGDGSWGPRYLTIALPFAILPLVALLDRARVRRWTGAAVAAVVAFGVAVQLLGVLVNFDWYILRSAERARHFSPPASPILAHARTLGRRADAWRERLFPAPDTAVLTGGFSDGDGNQQAVGLFPRWTTGAGAITLHPAAREPILVKLTFFDHRPAGQRAGAAEVLVNEAPLAPGAVERRDFSGAGEGWVYQFTVPAAALERGAAVVTLVSPTWNPRAAGQSDRDEELGVFVHNVEVWRGGQAWAVRQSPAIEPMPRTPRWRFWWFNNDATRQHPVDHWAWYAAAAGFDRGLAAGWIAAYAAVGAAILAAGLGLGLRSLPAGALRRAPRRCARRRKKPAVPARVTPTS